MYISSRTFPPQLTLVGITAEDLRHPDIPQADVGVGADPGEGQGVAAVLRLEVHCGQKKAFSWSLLTSD